MPLKCKEIRMNWPRAYYSKGYVHRFASSIIRCSSSGLYIVSEASKPQAQSWKGGLQKMVHCHYTLNFNRFFHSDVHYILLELNHFFMFIEN